MSNVQNHIILQEIVNSEIRSMNETLININFFLKEILEKSNNDDDNNIIIDKYCCQKEKIERLLEEKNAIHNDVENYLRKNCKHLWISDLVDNMSVSQEPTRVYYCNYCGLYI